MLVLDLHIAGYQFVNIKMTNEEHIQILLFELNTEKMVLAEKEEMVFLELDLNFYIQELLVKILKLLLHNLLTKTDMNQQVGLYILKVLTMIYK
jgi:hypothetical protein